MGAYLHTECAGEGYRIRTTTIRVGEYVYSDAAGGALSDPVRVTSRPTAPSMTSDAPIAPDASSAPEASTSVQAGPAAGASQQAPTTADVAASGELLLP